MLSAVVCTAAIIAALYYGKDLLIPFALAVLFSFLLTYPVALLERLKLGHAVSVVVVLLFGFSLTGVMIWIATNELTQIVIRLPEYQQNIQAKLNRIEHFGGSGGTSPMAKAARSIAEMGNQFSESNQVVERRKGVTAANSAKSATGRNVEPVPVRVVKQPVGPFGTLGSVGASIGRFLATAVAVILLTMFMLLNESSLRNRLFRLFGRRRINTMTTAIEDAGKRVSRYLITQGMVNCTYGLLLGTGLYFIGVPYAAFWGCAAIFLRFIPYLGTFIAGMAPFLLSLAVFDGWRRPLMALGLFAAVEGVISGIVEPWLYATRTGISSLAILISATFWTLVWGPIGLVMSTPLTVLLVVLGRHIPQFEFLYVLLGDEPVLAPEAHYYQRLLALDDDEARDVVEEFGKDKSLLEVYDSLLIPALSLAEEDRHENQLDERRLKFIYQSTREVIEELGDRISFESQRASQTVDTKQTGKVLCIPARDEADELVALMLAQCLRVAGYDADSIAIGFVEEMLSKVKSSQPDVLFISALPPFAVTHARSLCRKARQRCENVRTVVGLWGSTADRQMLQDKLGAECSDYLIHSIAEAELQMRLFAGKMPDSENEAPSETEEATSPVLP